MNIYNIDDDISEYVESIEENLFDTFKKIDKTAEHNFYRVLKAMQNAGLSEAHFMPSTGYGYDDMGREALESIFSEIFKTESALVRPHIASGTHAIACALYGNLRPGDELLSITGDPYDTVKTFVNSSEESGFGTLEDLGIKYKSVKLKDEKIDIDSVLEKINDKTKIVYLQRSSGYSGRSALSLGEIKRAVEKIKEKKDVIVFLDNCYGEFLDTVEPAECGIDLIAGSLIKNPGGGLAPTGGYVAGKREYVKKSAARLSAPGIAGDVGATLDWTKTVLQGLFLAPVVTANAIKAAVLIGAVYESLGYDVHPRPDENRSDIIEIISLGDSESVEVFCQAIQEAAPVNSKFLPVPAEIPGYTDPVIMAAGAFIQGSSIELSADAPIREPYNVYFQGGLTYYHGKLATMMSLQRLRDKNLLGEINGRKGKTRQNQ